MTDWFRRFHVCVHAAPELPERPAEETFAHGRLPCLQVAPADLPPFPLAFEETLARLEALPRLFAEPDGSFVWRSPPGEDAWQWEGNLYDREGRVLYLELQGEGPAPALEAVLRTLSWPETPVVLQLVQLGVFVTEPVFRAWAATSRS